MRPVSRRKLEAEHFKRLCAPLDVIDATEIDEPENADEMLALHTLYAEPGDTLVLHAAGCPTTRDHSWRCRCVPVAMVVGAVA